MQFGVYLKVLDYMKEGVKRFIQYTNDWKGRLQDAAPQFRDAQQVLAAEVAEAIPREEYTPVPKSRLADDSASAEEHKPALPAPPREETTRWIRFSKPVKDIRASPKRSWAIRRPPPRMWAKSALTGPLRPSVSG